MLDLLFGQHAAWFAVPALVGTLFFLVRLVGATAGLGFEGGEPDVPVDAPVDGTIHHDDSTSLFKFVSLQTVLIFAMGFGWTALGFYRGTGVDFPASALLGVLGGAALVVLFTKLLRATMRLEQSGTFDLAAAVGAEGDVYVTVPPAGSGRGQVRVIVGSRQRIVGAVSSAGELRPSTRVRVVRVNEDRSLIVEPVR